MRRLLRFVRVVVLVLFALPAVGLASDPQRRQIRDLHYGEVLFHFYKQDYFTAITQLLAYRELGRMANHRTDAELLLGGMDLSYGLHQEAGRVFHRVLDEHAEQPVRNRAWYYLGKISFQRGYFDQALDALRRVTVNPKGSAAFDHRVLLAQVLMAQNDYVEAAEVLRDWEGPEALKPYADYNLGVALIRSGQTEPGIQSLQRVGAIRARNAELQALKDKANLALGWILLEDDKANRARTHFERVRLHGPFSDTALLGAGWADAEREEYRKALAPWTELSERAITDVAVQESLLAVPYAYGELDAYGRATHLYQAAVTAYSNEKGNLKDSIAAIGEGKLVHQLLNQASESGMGWFWQLQELPNLPQTRYLTELLASHAFQEALKNFRDLQFLQHNLAYWADNIEVFTDMLAARRKRYQQQLPRAQHALSALDVAKLRDRRDGLAARLADIERSRDTFALATPEQHALWVKLQRIEDRLKALGGAAQINELTDKQRLLKGVVIWQLNEAYPQRLWQNQKQLNRLDAAIDELEARRESIEGAALSAPARFEGFDARIAQLSQRLEVLRPKVAQALDAQGRYLEQLAVAELEHRNQRLDAYLVQARFALARAYDRATSRSAQ